jgi:predicted nuclease of predicted toxin-antitoxin system
LDRTILLADENIHSAIILALRKAGFEVVSVRESMAGASDREVLVKAREISAILITEDSDFGELVFSHGIPAIGVIYLRYQWAEIETMIEAVLTLVSSRPLTGSFFAITPTKIRERKLP